MSPADSVDEAKRDVALLQGELHALLNLPSRWGGNVDLASPNAGYLGAKLWSCVVSINEDAWKNPVMRWPVLIHETLHALSAGMNPADYVALRGWEEGTVESLQRLLRPDVLAKRGVRVDQAAMDNLDRQNAYNGYIAALESLRGKLSVSAKDFYMALIAQPLRDRPAYIGQLAQQTGADQQPDWLAIWAAAERTLRRAP